MGVQLSVKGIWVLWSAVGGGGGLAFHTENSQLRYPEAFTEGSGSTLHQAPGKAIFPHRVTVK